MTFSNPNEIKVPHFNKVALKVAHSYCSDDMNNTVNPNEIQAKPYSNMLNWVTFGLTTIRRPCFIFRHDCPWPPNLGLPVTVRFF